MKYEEIALNEALELSDTELETIAGGKRHGWSEGEGGYDNGRRRRCHHRWNEDQGYGDFGYSGLGYGDFGYSGSGYGDHDYDRDDWQRRCHRREE